ncbi:MAG: TolC family protein [Kiritimatiellae bacterium]|jgi:outer membrane protein TolC|nr:TolC family protein [Kiritimatiellia bacterium]
MKFLLLLILSFTLTLEADDSALTLQAAWKMALADNPSEEVAWARLQQAEARYRQARSQYQPRLSLQASGSRVEYSDTQLLRIPDAPENSELYEAGLNATWLLWDNGTRKNQIMAGGLEAEAALFAQADSRETLLAQVGRAFTAAQLARANLRIAGADMEFQSRQLENSRRKEAAGMDSRTDRLNFEIRKLTSEDTAVQQSANYEGAMAALGALLGHEDNQPLPPPVGIDGTSASFPGDDIDIGDLWHQAQTQLPILQQVRLQEEAARASRESVRSPLGPELVVFGNLSAESEDDPAFNDGDLGNSVGLQLSLDLWDGQLRKQQVREADARVREAVAQSRQVRLQAFAELQQAFADYTASLKSETLSATILERSRENRDLIEASYEAGRETLLRLNEAQRDFNNAETRYATARLQRQLSWIELQKATGNLRAQVE